MSLKPILKVPDLQLADASDVFYSSTASFPGPFPPPLNTHLTPHVRWAPAPTFHEAYSSSNYDRKPIIVSKNVCALPPRGDRVYTLLDNTRERRRVRDDKRNRLHPCPHEPVEREPSPTPSLFVNDYTMASSEVDESNLEDDIAAVAAAPALLTASAASIRAPFEPPPPSMIARTRSFEHLLSFASPPPMVRRETLIHGPSPLGYQSVDAWRASPAASSLDDFGCLGGF
jgi:hypothetical protein